MAQRYSISLRPQGQRMAELWVRAKMESLARVGLATTPVLLGAQRPPTLAGLLHPWTGSWEAWGLCRAGQDGSVRRTTGRPTGACLPALLPPVQDIVFQLQRFVSTMSKYYNDCYAVLRDADVFPIEVDLAHTTLAYGPGQDEFTDGEDEEEEDEEDTAAGEPSRDAQGAAGPLDKGGSWCDS